MARDMHYHPAAKPSSCQRYWREWVGYMAAGVDEAEVLNSETGELCVYADGSIVTSARNKLPRPLLTTNVEKVTCYGCLTHISAVVQKNIREKASL